MNGLIYTNKSDLGEKHKFLILKYESINTFVIHVHFFLEYFHLHIKLNVVCIRTSDLFSVIFHC